MQPRRIAREKALQFLFQYEINHPENLDEALITFWDSQRMSAAMKKITGPTYGQEVEMVPVTSKDIVIRNFAEHLIRGSIDKGASIDEDITRHAKNWRFDRIATVDRSILKIGIFEIKFCDDIPPIVSINEAVDLAKKYSTEKSGKFVNGILDRIKSEVAANKSGPETTTPTA